MIERGTLILTETDPPRAGVYLGEDPDGTCVVGFFDTVEKVDPGTFNSAPAAFDSAVNAGPVPADPSVAPAVVGGVEAPTDPSAPPVSPTASGPGA